MPSQMTTPGSAEDRNNEQRGHPAEAVTEDQTIGTPAASDRLPPSAGPSSVAVHASRGDPGPVRSVVPSYGCGCKNGAQQKVYAIGELDIDYVSPARRDSIQANAPTLPRGFGFDNSIENRATFLRYLLGIAFRTDANVPDDVRRVVEQARQEALLNGNFYDAESVEWVLKQGECPLYAIRPQGAFAGAAYRQLVIFLIEQTFRNYQDFTSQAINEQCLDEFYPCYGGTQRPFRDSLSRPEAVSLVEGAEQERGESQPRSRKRGRREGTAEGQAEPTYDLGAVSPEAMINRAFVLFNEPSVSATHVAIAGEITGSVRLFTGEEVEVIAPVMRGMQNWNTRRLIELLIRSLGPNIAGFEAQVTLLALKIVSRLYELVRNPGKDPCDRAKNYLSTKELFNLAVTLSNPAFLSMLGAYGPPVGGDQRQMVIDVRQLLNITLDDLGCKPARCIRYGTEPYEVELSFYNFANQFMGTAVYSQTIDVSDVVPVAIDTPRVFPRRT